MLTVSQRICYTADCRSKIDGLPVFISPDVGANLSSPGLESEWKVKTLFFTVLDRLWRIHKVIFAVCVPLRRTGNERKSLQNVPSSPVLVTALKCCI